MTNTINNKKDFELWMKRLNKKLRTIALGFDTNDFADQPYYEWWEDGLSIDDAIAELGEQEGFSELI
ncbi:hypothetical protein [Myxosarcina sp. GI1(2024)]